jgi:hypothetical protein
MRILNTSRSGQSCHLEYLCAALLTVQEQLRTAYLLLMQQVFPSSRMTRVFFGYKTEGAKNVFDCYKDMVIVVTAIQDLQFPTALFCEVRKEQKSHLITTNQDMIIRVSIVKIFGSSDVARKRILHLGAPQLEPVRPSIGCGTPGLA